MATMLTARPAGPRRTGVRCGLGTLLGALTALLLAAPAAQAATIELHTGLPGADFDAILDGFPGLAVLDGAGDLPGNALAVALKAGVTEERALVELPLAPLVAAGVAPEQIVSAVLHFNVDDVLTTFGPGTDFDGTAGERIYVATYSGNGLVDLEDFARGALAATVVTGPDGAITDASVRTGGPIGFTADLTSSLKSLLAQGATHVGIAFSTDDSPTGTSIDDRGDGGSGAPGTGGATMPFLVVTTAEASPTPAPTATAAPTSAPTATPSPAPTSTPGPTQTPGPGPTVTPGSTTTPLPTAAPTPTSGQATPQPSATPAPTGGATSTPAVTATPSGSGTPAATATPASSATPAGTPTRTPTPRPTATPTATFDPNATPTPRPILTASPRPTGSPGTATPTPTSGTTLPPVTLLPDGSGDQLVSYYDARNGFTTFLNLHNLGAESIEVRVTLYDTALAQPFEHTMTLAAGATRTIDVGALRADGMPARAGAAFATAVDAAGDPIVTRALGGSFTVANLATGSAWGAPAAARRAVALGETVTTPPLGAPIDGDDVRLRGLSPDRLGLSVYYDPGTLEPATLGGNQLVFLSFDDDGASPVAATTTWSVDARRSDGSSLDAGDVGVEGVHLSHLEELLGDAAAGAAGSITFATTGGAGSRLVFFSESLGTFATGYLLPPLAD